MSKRVKYSSGLNYFRGPGCKVDLSQVMLSCLCYFNEEITVVLPLDKVVCLLELRTTKGRGVEESRERAWLLHLSKVF